MLFCKSKVVEFVEEEQVNEVEVLFDVVGCVFEVVCFVDDVVDDVDKICKVNQVMIDKVQKNFSWLMVLFIGVFVGVFVVLILFGFVYFCIVQDMCEIIEFQVEVMVQFVLQIVVL